MWNFGFSRKRAFKIYRNNRPILNFQKFFDGNLKFYGYIQDNKGYIVKYFTGNAAGFWQIVKGRIEITYNYDNSITENRVWNIELTSESDFVLYTSNIEKISTGHQEGNACNINYTLEFEEIHNDIIKIQKMNLEDWIFLINEKVAVNKTTFRKFFKTGSMTSIFIKN